MMKKYLILLTAILSSLEIIAQISRDDIQLKNLYSFYEEIIQKSNNLQGAEYRPQVEKGKKGFAILTVDKYCNILAQSGYFSTGFIELEKLRLKPCADGIARLKYSTSRKLELGDFPEGCEWFYYDYWFHAQDNPDRISVVATKSLTENSIEASFVFETGDEKNISQWETKCRAIMELESGSWKIGKLEFN